MGILSKSEFLEYAQLKYKFMTSDYNNFKCKVDNLKPYYYVFSIASRRDIESFKIFYDIYLKKSEIESEYDNIYDFVNKDVLNLLTFIVAVQYFFL